LTQERTKVVGEINDLFSSANFGSVAGVSDGKAALQKLRDDDAIWKAAGSEIKSSSEAIQEANDQIATLEARQQEIYQTCEVEFGKIDQVRNLMRQRIAFLEAKSRRDSLSGALNVKREALERDALYSRERLEEDSSNVTMIEAGLAGFHDRAARLGSISEKILQINTEISHAQRGNSLELALKEKEDKLTDLESMYDQNLSAATGMLLVNSLKKQVEERERPAVFQRANNLFRRITAGRFELRLKSSEPPAFAAYDAVNGQWRNLDDLSTGTRIQLLLSVRLAFVELLESSVSLPIVADELMANSDPVRAMAIMEALVEISRGGRQVFYFTSQADERARWEAFLADKPDVTRAVFVLEGRGSETYDLAVVRPDRTFAGGHLQVALPEVSGLNHAEYGELLALERFDVMAENAERLHIWHLFEDPTIVYNLLEKGLDRWGAARTYKMGGGVLPGVDDAIFDLAAVKAEVFKRFLELYRKDRPRRISRMVLEKSGAISGTFIDSVSELAERLENDPQLLLDALRRGDISGFRRDRIESLREYFLANGFMSEEAPMTAEDIWLHLAAFISTINIDLLDARSFVARILQTD
jgi:hypothetical protein